MKYAVLTGMNQRCYGHIYVEAENEEDLREKLEAMHPNFVDQQFEGNGDVDACDEKDIHFIGAWPTAVTSEEGWIDVEIDLENQS